MLSAIDVDGDELMYSILSFPSHGLISNFDVSTGTLTYIPSLNYNGSDSFTFEVEDALGMESDTAVVSITVIPVYDGPTAVTGGDQQVDVEDVLSETDVDDTPPVATNQPPVAENLELTLGVGSSLPIMLPVVDPDTETNLTFIIGSRPQNGELGGCLLYTSPSPRD